MFLGLDFYYSAFWDLASDRNMGFGVGPIPWSSMIKYCEVYNIWEDEQNRFITLVKGMDLVYLDIANSSKK